MGDTTSEFIRKGSKRSFLEEKAKGLFELYLRDEEKEFPDRRWNNKRHKICKFEELYDVMKDYVIYDKKLNLDNSDLIISIYERIIGIFEWEDEKDILDYSKQEIDIIKRKDEIFRKYKNVFHWEWGKFDLLYEHIRNERIIPLASIKLANRSPRERETLMAHDVLNIMEKVLDNFSSVEEYANILQQ